MAIDPFKAFEVGQSVGKSRRSAFGMTSDNIFEDFKKRQEEDRTLRKTLGGQMALKKFENELPMNEKEKAQTEMYRSAADLNKRIGLDGSSNGSLESLASESGFDESDYIQNPTVTRYKGQMIVQNAPKLKDPLDSKSTAEIGSFRRTRQNLTNNLNLMNPGVEKRMSPLSYSASRMPGSNFLLKAQSMTGDTSATDFLTFKAETDKVFQQFRKETTGAQAALKELGWLEPDYPMPTDPPEVYKNKANEAIRRLQEGEELLLNLYSQRGFRVGDLRRGTANPLLDASGQSRADTAQDASITSNEDPKSRLMKKLKERGWN
jgi:hypothetical protein